MARSLSDAGYSELAFQSRHAAAMRALPSPGPDGHKDPFDRLLVAQARTETIELATADRLLSLYGSGILTLS